MKKSPGNTVRRRFAPAVAAWAVALCAPAAHADVIDFETIVNQSAQADGTIYIGGDRFTTGAWQAVVADSAYVQSFPDYQPGLAGATIGAQESAACVYLACPWPISQYYAGLNDGSLTLSRADGGAFTIAGLMYGGIANEVEEGTGMPFGRLRLSGMTAAGAVLTAEADFPELHYWSTWTLDAAFAGTVFTRLTIDACAYAPDGACINGGDLLNASQFAIDNLQVSAVPEPSIAALLVTGLLFGVARRRAGGRP